MGLGAGSGHEGGSFREGACRPDRVCVGSADVAGLSGDGLRGWLKEVGRAESVLGGDEVAGDGGSEQSSQCGDG